MRGEVAPGADRAVEELRAIGKKVVFLTNNSGRAVWTSQISYVAST